MSVVPVSLRKGKAVVVPGRVELPTSTLSVWRSNQLSYRTVFITSVAETFDGCRIQKGSGMPPVSNGHRVVFCFFRRSALVSPNDGCFQKGGVPAAPSGTATLLRLSPNHRFHPRPTLAVTAFRHPRLSWLDGRCVQGPGTYSPRHG